MTLQYLPHVMELVASCKQRISVTLEAGLIGALTLVPHALDCLRDATLMELLSVSALPNSFHLDLLFHFASCEH